MPSVKIFHKMILVSGLTSIGVLAPPRNTSTPANTTDVGQSGDLDDHGLTVNTTNEGLGNTVVGNY